MADYSWAGGRVANPAPRPDRLAGGRWRSPRAGRKCVRRKRYAIAFSTKSSAIANPDRLFARRDVDAYDAICDHLLVLNHAGSDARPATARRSSAPTRCCAGRERDYGDFYTAGDSISATVIARHDIYNSSTRPLPRARAYRNERTMNCCGTASRAMCGGTAPTSCRLRQPRRHRPRQDSRCRCRSCAVARGRRKTGARGRCPTLCRDEPNVEGSDQPEGALRCAAAGQRLSAVRRLYRRRRRSSITIRHHPDVLIILPVTTIKQRTSSASTSRTGGVRYFSRSGAPHVRTRNPERFFVLVAGFRAQRFALSRNDRKPQPPQRHFLDLVARDLLQDEVGALARRDDVLVQIDQIDARPDRRRGLDRFRVGRIRIAVEVRFRIAERCAAQSQKSVDVPRLEHVLVGVEIDREIEKIRHERNCLPSFGRRPVCSTFKPSTMRMSGRSTSTHWFGVTS